MDQPFVNSMVGDLEVQCTTYPTPVKRDDDQEDQEERDASNGGKRAVSNDGENSHGEAYIPDHHDAGGDPHLTGPIF
jgi:hypothetical protein